MNTAGFLHSFHWKTQPSSKQSHQQPKGFKMTTKGFSFKSPVESVLRTEFLLKSLQEVVLIEDILKIQKVTFSGLSPGDVVTCCTKFRKNTSFLHPKMPNKIHPDRSAPMSAVLSSASVMSCFILFSSRDDGYGVLEIKHLPNLGQSVQIFCTPAVALQGKRTYHWKSHTRFQTKCQSNVELLGQAITICHRENFICLKIAPKQGCSVGWLESAGCWVQTCPPPGKKAVFARQQYLLQHGNQFHELFSYDAQCVLVGDIYIYIVCFCCCCCFSPWRNKICQKE